MKMGTCDMHLDEISVLLLLLLYLQLTGHLKSIIYLSVFQVLLSDQLTSLQLCEDCITVASALKNIRKNPTTATKGVGVNIWTIKTGKTQARVMMN